MPVSWTTHLACYLSCIENRISSARLPLRRGERQGRVAGCYRRACESISLSHASQLPNAHRVGERDEQPKVERQESSCSQKPGLEHALHHSPRHPSENDG